MRLDSEVDEDHSLVLTELEVSHALSPDATLAVDLARDIVVLVAQLVHVLVDPLQEHLDMLIDLDPVESGCVFHG